MEGASDGVSAIGVNDRTRMVADDEGAFMSDADI